MQMSIEAFSEPTLFFSNAHSIGTLKSFSFFNEDDMQEMNLYVADSPKGTFKKVKRLYKGFSIDSHAVQNESGLFLILSINDVNAEKIDSGPDASPA